LYKGRTKFKLGDVKAAHDYLHESLHYVPNSEAEFLLKEVEKMAYFETLIDPSFQNPLHQASVIQQVQWDYEFSGNSAFKHEPSSFLPTFNQGYVLDSTVRSNMPTPKLITQHRFKSGKAVNSWQGAFLLYNKKCLQETTVKT
jgi:hypothetical protein